MNVVNHGFAPAATPAKVVATFPASSSQAQFFFLDRLSPGDPTLNVTMRWEIKGEVSFEHLEQAYRHVIDRHEILRTRLVMRDGEAVQEVLSGIDFKLDLVDLARLKPDARDARMSDIFSELARQPFDLGQAGLLRATLVRCGPQSAVLMNIVHHSVFDGFSIGVLSREIGVAAAFAMGKAPDLPDLPLQFGDYTLWQQEYQASGVMAENIAYWKQQLTGAPYFELEADKPRPAQRSNRVISHVTLLAPDFEDSLKNLAQRHRVSPFVIGASVVSRCLSDFTGAPEILFGTPIAGRTETELETLIGPLVSSQVLRLAPGANPDFADHVAATKTVVAQALAHQDLAFSKVVAAVNPPRDPKRTPIVSVFFNLLHMYLQRQDFGPFEMVSLPPKISGAARDVDFTLIGRPSGWQLVIDYTPDLFEEARIDRIAAEIVKAFQAVFAPGKSAPLPAAEPVKPQPAAKRAETPEAGLLADTAVDEAAIVQTDRGPYGFVVARRDCAFPLENLPGRLMAQGHNALIGISVLAQMPRLPDGRADQQKLLAFCGHSAGRSRVTDSMGTDAVCQKIAAIWQDILGIDAIPFDANFFSLGGHSLLAVRLTARIREAFNGSQSVADIYENPTIAGQAGLIAGPAPAPLEMADWRVEHLIPDGPGVPIIAVNDVGIILSAARRLSQQHKTTCVRLFDKQRGTDMAGRSFLDIAKDYAGVIKQAQPKGPYLLFGVCVHGNIALEAARILRAGGDEVLGVVMKDVWEPGYVAHIQANPKLARQNRIMSLRNKIRMVKAGQLSFDAFLGSYRILRRSGVLRLAKWAGLIGQIRESDLEPEQQKFVFDVSAARNVYRPEPVDFPVLHVVTGISARGKGFAPSIGWEFVIKQGLKTVTIDEVNMHGGREIGADALACEIDGFIASVSGAS